jgi:hypothetical protein
VAHGEVKSSCAADTHDISGESAIEGGPNQGPELEEVGSLPVRATMGDGEGGLFGGRKLVRMYTMIVKCKQVRVFDVLPCAWNIACCVIVVEQLTTLMWSVVTRAVLVRSGHSENSLYTLCTAGGDG